MNATGNHKGASEMENTNTLIESLAIDCADAAADACGDDLVSHEPMAGDWDYLAEQLGRAPTAAERAIFVASYVANK